MSRIVKPPEERRKELIGAALKLFCEKGYEQTSIRDILEAVGGEVGMFYHYFESKDEVFRLALEKYMDDFIGEVAALAGSDTSDTVTGLIAAISRAILPYKNVWAGKLHWSVASAVHKKTLERLLPYVEQAVARIMRSSALLEIHDTSVFLLYGISGILHEKPWAEMPQSLLQEKLDFIAGLASRLVK
jgi:AcrR family transcriptional regulator